jgi:predicted ABC-type ATPase
MFAGPNGSGKSTLESYLRKELLGVYSNPDEIEPRELDLKSDQIPAWFKRFVLDKIKSTGFQ